MKYSSTHLIYFSPTHTSVKIAYAITEGMGVISMSGSDVTCESLDMREYINDRLMVIVAPVCDGRVAETAMERFRIFRLAHHVPIVPVVLYGSRDYEDILREPCDLALEQEFVPVAAGAFIGEHSLSRKGIPITEGRPGESDPRRAMEFGKKITEELEKVSCAECLPALRVKGNLPYRVKGPFTPQAPVTDNDLCTQCEYCVDVRPTHTISLIGEGMYSDPNLCTKCYACVRECSEGAHTFDTPYTAMLHKNSSVRREPEIFFQWRTGYPVYCKGKRQKTEAPLALSPFLYLCSDR